jgi:hypothetical protein
MSRKWQRMVEKNQKDAYKRSKKKGTGNAFNVQSNDQKIHKGRSWLVPLALISFCLFFVLVPGQYYTKDKWYWFTVISYLFLGVFIFFTRRPFLRITRSDITSRRFGGNRTYQASEIHSIHLKENEVSIQFKQQRTKWVFTRWMHRFQMDRLMIDVKQFAERNQLPLNDNRKVIEELE